MSVLFLIAMTAPLTACSEGADDTDTGSTPLLEILSPGIGEELFVGGEVWLEAAASTPSGTALPMSNVLWIVHGTDWTTEENGIWVTDLPTGWGLLLVYADVEDQRLYADIEVVVEDNADIWNPDRSPDDTQDTGLDPEEDTGGVLSSGIGHVLSLAYTPSEVFEGRGYTDCTSTYSTNLEPRTSGGMCPHTDLTVEGPLAMDAGDCPGQLLASIPEQVVYGIDRGNPEGWGMWVADEGTWVGVGAAVPSGSSFLLDTTLTVTLGGIIAGEVDFRFEFTP